MYIIIYKLLISNKMNSLNNFLSVKQKAYSSHRPCYPVPQYMSEHDSNRVKNARENLQQAYKNELAKPQGQRNSNLLYEMDRELYP